MAESKTTFSGNILAEGDCPFCTGSWVAAQTDQDEDVVLHSMPPCQMFIDHEPNTYLQSVRVYIEQHPAEFDMLRRRKHS